MKRAAALLLMILGVPYLYGQQSQSSAHPLDLFPICEVLLGSTSGIRCPNRSSCGTYTTYQVAGSCEDYEGPCSTLSPISTCCGAYQNYIAGGGCSVAEMRDPRVRSRILELAETNQILVPTCSGAYVPARAAFRQYKKEDKENGGF
jgi:hypothetical protein